MNLDQITTKCWILALFERDDGERLLLGDGWFDFKDSLQHFQPNTFANDVIELQGSDGQMLAGQVRRSASQSFDGYIGDPITNRQTIEQHRREFLMFFRKRHHYKVVYIFPDGTAIQRKQGYITDAPSVPEIRQRFPEYHVALNFEDVNYYEYAENAQGQEIFSNIRNINISTAATGGLVWDNLGAVSDQMGWKDIATATGQMLTMTNPESIKAPIASFEMTGNIEQTTYAGKNLFDPTATPWRSKVAYNSSGVQSSWDGYYGIEQYQPVQPNTQYTFSNSTGKPIHYGIVFYDANKAKLSNIFNDTTTFTTPANCAYIRFAIQNGSAPTWTQLEKGSTATAYEPYVGGIPAPNPNYPQPIETVTGRQTVTVAGKNLFDKDSANIANYFAGTGGVSYYSADAVTIILPVVAGETYTASTTNRAKLANTPSLAFSDGIITSSGTAFLSVTQWTSASSVSATAPNGAKYMYLYIKWSQDATAISEAIATIQVEQGSTATAFEPYKGQNYEINLTGKNMLDVSVGYRYGFIQSNGQYSANNIIVLFNGFIPVEPSTTYTFSSNHSNWNMTAVLYADMTTFIDRNLKSGVTANTFTTPSNCHFVRLQVNYNNQAMTDEIVAGLELQFEKGGSASAYEAYHSIKLCRIPNTDHRDRIYKQNGKWYLRKEISCELYDGTESGWRSDAGRIEYYDSSIMLGSSSDNAVVCDYYTTAWGVGTCIFISGTRPAVCIIDPNNFAQNLDMFKAWIANHNLTIAYALATPTTTEITNESLVAELNRVEGLKLFPGQNNITDQTPNARPTMTVQYYTALGPGGGLVWESGEAGGATIIEASGLDSAFPLWTVPGPSTNPTLTNITTGQSITWQGTVPAGQTLEIDMDKQTATLAGANVYAFVSGDWIRIDPGSNRMTYVGTGATQASTLSWNNIVG